MRSLNEDLKIGKLEQIYLLYGEEAYLKRQYKEKLSKASISEGDQMNYAYFEGKSTNVFSIIELAETMPFFADFRLIVMENTGFFKKATPELADYIKEIPSSTRLLFVEEEVDKRGKLFKEVKAKGRVVELGQQDERTLMRWVEGLIKKEQTNISQKAVRHLITKVGTDMENLQTEVEKLCCYTLDKDIITEEDIDVICINLITNQIFAMTDAVADKKGNKALALYSDLISLKEPPMRILYMLVRQFRLLRQVKELNKKGFAKSEIAKQASIHPFVVGKYLEQEKRFSAEELSKIITAGVSMEEDIKTGRITDNLGVEVFIVKYSASR